ncbi:TAT-binding protein-like protein 7, AAA ATPase [Malassezia cuniculi]|uniref:TAT-binding protein-like protein 7, AAA ATPase n=1 Tax=Malassezia cuniculi TaxID=948313 RepID=A0AAF0J4H5_9BASI|nr:TAT-binding protein-like protein 7, AAA ATPase [Malassezia cuniculi]
MPTPHRRSARSASSDSLPRRSARGGRPTFFSQYFAEDELDSDTPDATANEEEPAEEPASPPVRFTRSGRRAASYVEPEIDISDDERPRRSRRVSKAMRDFVASDDNEVDDDADFGETMHERRAAERNRRHDNLMSLAAMRAQRAARRAGITLEETHASDAQAENASEESSQSEEEGEQPSRARSYSFRTRKKVNYSLVASEPEFRPSGRRAKDQATATESIPRLASLPLSRAPRSMRAGAWLPDYAIGDAADSSDDERRPMPIGGAGGVLLGPDLNADSTGRVRGDALADIDPLGTRMDIDFSHVGGLDTHVQQLKEMVSLPLLYPEVFERFGITPPRGVLFHGPPGTGKTLVARALAASCSSSEQKISFFMRKGADCLSKWVGEAERQLRLLFEEAKKAQPSIIFFDEIDGLAPVRSSKQDQIHASIVSTLLALMDGMDGRGQVVVIGATNRPDAVDPALRRPGRFDREFYFPLPSREARRSIIEIHTRNWQPPLPSELGDVLADATKGFGGADIRALCTEATLNAIQRHYPQIYKTNDRLALDPASISVEARDFMLALKKLVPSSARSMAPSFAPLAPHLEPLVGDAVAKAYATLERVLPHKPPPNALEEAMWEPCVPGGSLSAGQALERELAHGALERARIFRPRLIIHGAAGLGQRAVCAALLHRIERLHVQTLSVSKLLGDSAQTPESVLVQQCTEARSLRPSVLFVPELDQWPLVLSESVRRTFAALLDSYSGDDSVMLLGASETPLNELPDDMRRWFGWLPVHVELNFPDTEGRLTFFSEIARLAARPPSDFPDALPRRRRVLAELPIAPPRPPRQLSAHELRVQEENDARLLEHLKFRLGPVLGELRKKFKKFTRDVFEEYNLRELMEQFDWKREKGKVIITLRYEKDKPEEDSEAEEDTQDDDEQEEAQSEDAESGADDETGGEVEDASQDDSVKSDPQPAAEDVAVDEMDIQESRVAVDDDALQKDSAGSAADQEPLEDAGNDAVQSTQDSCPENSGPDTSAPADAAAALVGAAPEGSRGLREDPEDPRYLLRDLEIYTMTLEKMQRRLYYNEYLTCDAFMDDLGKIVANAEAAKEVDADRLFRAHQMRNLAVILVDQYIDASFREECARMAQRVAQRAAQAEAQRAAEQHPGQRHSARIMGQAAEPMVDVSLIERSHKRARSTSHNEENKRVKMNDSCETDTQPDQEKEPEAEQETPLVLSTESLLDEPAQQKLAESLSSLTRGFSVEQLEQVRAACVERVLAHRSSWHRDALLEELHDLVQSARSAVGLHDTT